MTIIAETSRLWIRQWTPDDDEVFFELSKDQGFNAFSITTYRQDTLEDARQWIDKMCAYYKEHKFGLWMAAAKADGKVVGICGLKKYQSDKLDEVEITYRLKESAWKKAFATELAWTSLEGRTLRSTAWITLSPESLNKHHRKVGIPAVFSLDH